MHPDIGKRRFPLCSRPCSVLPYDAAAGVCRRCGKALTGRQTSWCSAACRVVYEENHYWGFARRAALRRDRYQCVRGCAPTPLPGRPYAGLEVNHKVPRNGRGYGMGCHHHLDNLETLCHRHHVKVTRAQRIARSRTRGRRAQQLDRLDRATRN